MTERQILAKIGTKKKPEIPIDDWVCVSPKGEILSNGRTIKWALFRVRTKNCSVQRYREYLRAQAQQKQKEQEERVA